MYLKMCYHQYLFTNILKVTKMLTSDFISNIVHSTNCEALWLLFSSLFLIIISNHFKQNLFLWAGELCGVGE